MTQFARRSQRCSSIVRSLAAGFALAMFAAGCVTVNTVGSEPWAEDQRARILVQRERGQITEGDYIERLKEIIAEREAYEARVEAAKTRSKQVRYEQEQRRQYRNWRFYGPDRYLIDY